MTEQEEQDELKKAFAWLRAQGKLRDKQIRQAVEAAMQRPAEDKGRQACAE